MGKIIDALRAYLDNEDWPFEVHADRPAVRFEFRGANATFSVVAHERNDEQLLVYALSPEPPVATLGLKLAELVARANYGMAIGNFELDVDDGEVRYKTSLAFGDNEPTRSLIEPLVVLACLMMDKYIPALRALAAGQSAEQAIAAVELAKDESSPAMRHP